MPSENHKEHSLKDNLKKSYRFILQRKETFEEKISFNFTIWQAIASGILTFILLTISIGSLIIFTPLKKMVPGYGELAQYEEITSLNKELDELEQQLIAQKTYTTRFMNMLRDSVENEESVKKQQKNVDPQEHILSVKKVKEDAELRNEIAEEKNQKKEALLAKSSSESRVLPLNKLYFIPPLKGRLSGSFMPEKKHLGVDLVAPKNTPIKTVMDGFVIVADWTMESGQTIGIQHQNNIITFYKHNSSLLKKQGDFVKAGEAIAIIGNTGTHTDGPHLHFELWQDGKALNPVDYIQF